MVWGFFVYFLNHKAFDEPVLPAAPLPCSLPDLPGVRRGRWVFQKMMDIPGDR